MGELYLKHGKKQVFFSAFILVPIYGEHDGLQEVINLSHVDQPAEVCDMSRFGLKEEEKVAVFLRLVIVGECAMYNVRRLLEMTGKLVLLHASNQQRVHAVYDPFPYLFYPQTVMDEQGNPRIQVSHILFQNKVSFRLC